MKKITLMALLILGFQQAKSQDLGTIILAADDASLLAKNYLDPAAKGLMYSMNGGWFTTAKTHSVLGFDITINANASFVPSSAQMFAFNPVDYRFLSLPNGEKSLPTVMSENDLETQVDISIPVGDGTYKVASFQMPGGIAKDLPLNAVPTPMVQVGVGLPFNTDIKARFVPKLTFDDSVDASLIGFGLQHSLSQYFKPMDNLPLNVSVLAAFTNMKVVYNMDDEDPNDNVQITNGATEFKMNSWTVQALASLDFKIVTVYGSVGYNAGKSTAKMKGEYTLTYDIVDENDVYYGTIEDSIKDPVNIDFESTGVRATLGTRLNLGVFKIFADYTLQEYNTASAGIAFSFR